jgi:acetylornithine deacetylase/succinyl-diaminopimelate desuccinylase-like protein
VGSLTNPNAHVRLILGPKVVGSEANEVLAANYILQHLREVKANASNPDDIVIDHQIASGHNFESMIYVNLQNIVVRLQGESDHALMLNCHFDSVPGSPGASDNIVSAAVY